MTLQLVVFDIAGTTVTDRQNVHQALQTALAQFGISVTIPQVNDLMGYPKPVAIEKLLQVASADPATITPTLIHQIHSVFVQAMVDFTKRIRISPQLLLPKLLLLPYSNEGSG